MVSLVASGSWIVKSAQEINVCEKVVARNVRSILCGAAGLSLDIALILAN